MIMGNSASNYKTVAWCYKSNFYHQGVQELFFCELKGSEIAELNRRQIKCFIKQTTVSDTSPYRHHFIF